MSWPSHAELLAMKDAGNCWVGRDDGSEFWWPFCTVTGCSNRACLRLNSERCYPHTLPGVPILSDEEDEVPAETVSEQSK